MLSTEVFDYDEEENRKFREWFERSNNEPFPEEPYYDENTVLEGQIDDRPVIDKSTDVFDFKL